MTKAIKMSALKDSLIRCRWITASMCFHGGDGNGTSLLWFEAAPQSLRSSIIFGRRILNPLCSLLYRLSLLVVNK